MLFRELHPNRISLRAYTPVHAFSLSLPSATQIEELRTGSEEARRVADALWVRNDFKMDIVISTNLEGQRALHVWKRARWGVDQGVGELGRARAVGQGGRMGRLVRSRGEGKQSRRIQFRQCSVADRQCSQNTRPQNPGPTDLMCSKAVRQRNQQPSHGRIAGGGKAARCCPSARDCRLI